MKSNPSIDAIGLAILAMLLPTVTFAGDLRLPAGSSAAGLESFVELRCIQCHTVKGAAIDHPETGKRINLPLAAEERFVRTYEDLFTAITNPRHVIRQQYAQLLSGSAEGAAVEPFMLDLTPTMTVRQLIDIVAFLDERYAANVTGYTTQP